MKNKWFFVLLFLGAAQLGRAQTTANPAPVNANTNATDNTRVVIQRGSDTRVWAKVNTVTDAAGKVTTQTNATGYCEIGSGLCYLDNNGVWQDAVAQLNAVADGASGTQAQITAHWMGNINAGNGALTVTLPEGQQLVSSVYGLAYLDKSTGASVLFATLKDTQGQMMGNNKIVYMNCFNGVSGDIEYVYSIEGVEQNIVLRGQPPAPDAAYNLNPQTTVVQVWTQFFNPPAPQITPAVDDGVAHDAYLSFGKAGIGMGSAFFIPGQGANVGTGNVHKHWGQVNGLDFLVEEIGWPAIANFVQALPQHASAILPGRSVIEHLASAQPSPRNGVEHAASKPMRMAKAEAGRPGLLMDYSLVTSVANMTFQSGATYYISGNVTLTGTNATYEGCVVVKFNTNVTMTVNAPVTCLSGPFRPIVLTAKDDNSVGGAISGSTGNPGANYYAATAFSYNASTAGTNLALHHFRVLNAQTAVAISGGSNHVISHVQMVNCAYGLSAVCTNFSLWNGLMDNVLTNFIGTSTNTIGDVEHLTVDSALTFNSGETLNVTNSVLYAVTNLGAINNSNFIYSASSGSGIFTSVGGGYHYLPTNTTYGASSIISPVLAAALQQMTVFPPILKSGTISTATTLSPQAARDTGISVSGYHYDALDYVVTNVNVTSTLTLTNGVRLGVLGSGGLTITGNLVSQGGPTALDELAPGSAVQETATPTASALLVGGGSGWGKVSLRFTETATLGGANCFINISDSGGLITYGPLTLRDCLLHGWQVYAELGQYNGGGDESSLTLNLTNNLLDRCQIGLWRNSTAPSVLAVNSYNNLYHGGLLQLGYYMTSADNPPWGGPPQPPSWNFYNNLFENLASMSEVGTDPYGGSVWQAFIPNSHNGYVNTTSLANSGGGDQTPATADYQTGTLGSFYYASSGTGLATLIHTGSTAATNLGLYHYTVTTNNAVDGTNVVSIGFHYIATDNSGNPLDTDGDGLPDYVKDANGDGVFDAGDVSDWQNPFTIYDQGVNYGAAPGHVRLGDWKFGLGPLTNQAGAYPLSTNGLDLVPDWSGYAVGLTNTGTNSLMLYNVASNGQVFFNPSNGTIRWWFQPNWSSGDAGQPASAMLFGAAFSGYGYWYLQALAEPNNETCLQLNTANGAFCQVWSFKDGAINGAVLHFQSNLWYQMALTYSPTNMAIYTNGVLLATACMPPYQVSDGAWLWEQGDGLMYYPSPTYLSNGFSLGNVPGDSWAVLGQVADLETFNYPLTAEAVGAGFPGFDGNATNMLDTYYVGRSDMLQSYVDGVFPPVSGSAAPCRLGYWRFDSPWLYSEEGQLPISQSGVTLTPSWSGTALNIGSAANSHVTYSDVGTNGWANINCRQGSLRFWFKPNGNAAVYPAPFVYLGSPAGSNGWALELANSSYIDFVAETNGVGTGYDVEAGVSCLSVSNWTQIVLTYGPAGCIIYTNGVVANSNMQNTNWPGPADRRFGMVLGNDTGYAHSINGQFEEMETFNYPLSAAEIASNFQAVLRVDSNLNGIPDLLEEIRMNTSRPFLGAPVTVTGTIEAEQFDMGQAGVAYGPWVARGTNSYRPTGLFITNCDDNLGTGTNFGYCLDQLCSNEWANYTFKVLTPGLYVVESRVEGIGTNGAFEFQFSTNWVFYTNTGSLVITNAGWQNISTVVYLPAGINVMMLQMTTNANTNHVYGTNVARFNYFSIYPWWQAGVDTTVFNNVQAVTMLATNNDYLTALGNANSIQSAVNSLGAGGGTVLIPSGTYYVAQANPNEANDAYLNSAVSITANNIEISGAGKTNTTLVAYNRATTVFCLGKNPINVAQCTNFALCNMTIEGQPHWAVSGTIGPNTIYDTNQLIVPYGTNDQNMSVFNGLNTGAPTAFYGSNSFYSYNILISNCQYLYGWNPITIYNTTISNVLVRSCDFNMWGGTTNINFGNVAFFGQGNNFVVMENTFNGNTNLTNATFTNVSTNLYFSGLIAPAGFVFIQGGGNNFIARNTIRNYYFEAIQVTAGPTAVTGNTYESVVSCPASCALNAFAGAQTGLSGTSADYATSFVGNWVYGGRYGELGATAGLQTQSYVVNVSGNYFQLYPPYDTLADGAGAAVMLQTCQTANVCGNTLAAGGYGLAFGVQCTNVLVLMNDFSGATRAAIGGGSAGSYLPNAVILRNKLGEGATYHVQLPYPNNFGWFLSGNQYLSGTNVVAPFLDPVASSAHVSQ